MPSPLADITRFLSGYKQGQLESEERDYVRGQRALEAEDRAAVLRETGYSPSVLKAQQIRMNMEKMRREAEDDRIARVSGNAARLIAMGRTQEGTKMLADNGLDAVQAEDDPDDPNFVHFATQGGKYRVPRTAAALIAADPIQFAKNEYALDKMLADQQFKAAEAEKKRLATADENAKNRASREKMFFQRIRQVGTKTGYKSARMEQVMALSKNYQENEGMEPGPATAKAFRVVLGGETDYKNRALTAKTAVAVAKIIGEEDPVAAQGLLKDAMGAARAPRQKAPVASKDGLPERPWEKKR